MKASPITPFIKFFDDKYIDLDEFKTVADLEKLPIYSFKFFNKKDTKIISKIFDLNVIEDLSKLDKNKPFD
jgi:hypothetical protein